MNSQERKDAAVRQLHDNHSGYEAAIADIMACLLDESVGCADGKAQQLLASRPMERHISEGRYQVFVHLYTYLRFLDMQYRQQPGRRKSKGRKGNLYNRVVWPILFHEVLPELRYGLTNEVRQALRSQLETALGSGSKT